MAAELGGLLFGGGLMLAGSLYAATFDEQKIDFPAKDEAIKLFNKQYEEASKRAEDNIVLAPKFGDSLANLRYALTSLGFKVENLGEDQFVTVDLSPLIRAEPSFASERKLSSALFAAGLVMSPGEANGLTTPGFFRILCTTYTAQQVDAIRSKLLKVLQTFKLHDTPAAPTATSVRTSAPISRSATAESTASSTTSKKSRAVAEESETESVTSTAKAAPTTEKKKRRTGL